MDTRQGSIRLDTLLAHAGWMRTLARSLVRDPADAEDIVQATWLEALRRPPRDPAAADGWLARVLRNFALRRYRAEGRRRAREVKAARPEQQENAPDALLEKLEMHRLVAAEVAALAEPYRSTVLLRFFEERSAAEVARIQGVPLDTVKTRLRRALAELRQRLDRRHGGGGQAWRLALLPLAGLVALPAASEAAAVGSAAGAGVGAGAGAGAVPASLGWTILGNGGLIMSQKVFVAGAVAAAVVASAAGFGIGRRCGTLDQKMAMERFGLVSLNDHEALRARCKKAETALARAESDARQAAAGKQALEARVATLVEEAKVGTGSETGEAEDRRPPPPIAFGPVADLEAIREADWQDLAQAVAAIQSLHVELEEKVKETRTVSPEWRSKLEEQRGKLLALAGKVFGQVPTNGIVNGELTHPLILSNLMAGLMESAGHPFTREQRAEIAAVGEDYEAQYASLQKDYGEDTSRLQKVLDEIELKRNTMNAVEDILTAEQRDAAVPPQLREHIGFDTLSPLLMAKMSAQERPVESAEAMRAALPRMAAEMYDLDAAQAQAAAPLFDTWLREVEPVLTADQTGLTESAALTTGRAQLKLIQGLLHLPGLSAASRAALLTAGVWVVPQLPRHGG